MKNSQGPELPAWVFLALRLGSLVLVGALAVAVMKCG